MDSTIISTAITAVASLLTALIGMYIGKNQPSSLSSFEIRKKQLEKIYVPIEKMLNSPKNTDVSKTISEIQTIFDENYELVPPSMMDVFLRIVENPDSQKVDFLKFKRIVSCFFNWSRKKLKYPYDHSAIDKRLMKKSDRNPGLNNLFLWITTILLAFYVGLFIAVLITKGSALNLQICAVTIVIGILGVLEALDTRNR